MLKQTKLMNTNKNIGRVSPIVRRSCFSGASSSLDSAGFYQHVDTASSSSSLPACLCSHCLSAPNSSLHLSNVAQNSGGRSIFCNQRMSGNCVSLPEVSEFNESPATGTRPTLSALSSSYSNEPEVEIHVNNLDPSIDVREMRNIHVNNLDPNIDVREMRNILLSVFQEYTKVMHFSLRMLEDKSLKVVVRVMSLREAQFAVSNLHGLKIGSRRILLSYQSSDSKPPLQVLRCEVLALLNDVPFSRISFRNLKEKFQNRYNRAITVSDLTQMDMLKITEETGDCIVCLKPDCRITSSYFEAEGSHQRQCSTEKPFCEHHFQQFSWNDWTKPRSTYPLPKVCVSLKTLGPRVHKMLDNHHGSIPLNSFCSCYVAQFGPLTNKDKNTEVFEDKENLVSDGQGVPLEYLLTCIPGVEITKSGLGIKQIQWYKVTNTSQGGCKNKQSVEDHLALFKQEMVELLKIQPQCLLPFDQFVPAYHQHFGHQCCVGDYEFTKLTELLEAVSDVVQILGQGSSRMLTLTHLTQVKRFGDDILRVLRSRASKQIFLSELPIFYEHKIGRKLQINSYGICTLTDMLAEVADLVEVTKTSEGTVITKRNRGQTTEEVERTRQFAMEVVELLNNSPSGTMLFSKFTIAYHRQYGRQCKVSKYGFNKLMELLEAVSDVVELKDMGDDKVLLLRDRQEVLNDLAVKIVSVLEETSQRMIPFANLPEAYFRVHNEFLNFQDYGFSSLQDLLSKLNHAVKMLPTPCGIMVVPVNRAFLKEMSLKVCRLLMEQPNGKISMNDLCSQFSHRYGQYLHVSLLQQELQDVVQIDGEHIGLTPQQMLARDVVILIQESGGKISLQHFEKAFFRRYRVPIRPAVYGYASVLSMAQDFSDYITVQGRRKKRILAIKKEIAGSPFPLLPDARSEGFSVPQIPGKGAMCEEKVLQLTKKPDESADLLNQPVPSNLPPPVLQPESKSLDDRDLIGFDPVACGSSTVMDVQGLEEQQHKILSLSPSSVTSPADSLLTERLYNPVVEDMSDLTSVSLTFTEQTCTTSLASSFHTEDTFSSIPTSLSDTERINNICLGNSYFTQRICKASPMRSSYMDITSNKPMMTTDNPSSFEQDDCLLQKSSFSQDNLHHLVDVSGTSQEWSDSLYFSSVCSLSTELSSMKEAVNNIPKSDLMAATFSCNRSSTLPRNFSSVTGARRSTSQEPFSLPRNLGSSNSYENLTRSLQSLHVRPRSRIAAHFTNPLMP
ncbi:meiosis regulator and mRNA stability factor 1-like isoform X2 [Tachypleus tridentatus]|uniref:meiosis regulator and mRNA stability factor 1-like isoform X2 n=1 Tax=Tachypleus tridentatus TaxID=6853 RepID=UPI003FD5D712